jgi:protein gp37
MSTTIEWTDEVWNPVTGCTKVSAGCAHCYAETVARRFWPAQYPVVRLNGAHPASISADQLEVDIRDGLTRARRFTDVWCHPERLDIPLRWRKPRRVFVNSMSDLFHEAVPDSFIDRVFAVMALCPQHTFQVLTKRPKRMHGYLTAAGSMCSREAFVNGEIWIQLGTRLGNKIEHGGNWRCKWPLPNLWLGVSVEDQATANERIPQLLKTPATLRFVSAEPLLEPIDLREIRVPDEEAGEHAGRGFTCNALQREDDLTLFNAPTHLDWVIVGGESGPKARPCHVAWIQGLVGQCHAAATPCFVKQLGADPRWTGADSPPIAPARGKCANPAEWPEDLRVREMPEVDR